MAKIRSKDTKPELLVRRLVHSMGYRYRLHRKDVPGTPDLSFIAAKKAIFVHGCFWHVHSGCPRASIPSTNSEFWRAKLAKNATRDLYVLNALRLKGWRCMVIWECELAEVRLLENMIQKIMEN